MKETTTTRRGSYLTLYMRSMSQEEAGSIRRALSVIAYSLGYRVVAGPTVGEGSIGPMLQDIARGDLVVTKAPRRKVSTKPQAKTNGKADYNQANGQTDYNSDGPPPTHLPESALNL